MVQQFQQAPQPARGRVKAEGRYPVYDLDNSIEVARSIRDDAGGSATAQQIASFLNYRSTTSGAFITRIASARLFGLIESSGQSIVPTPLAIAILAPEHPGFDDRRARIQAFFNVPLYRTLYDRYKSGQLPPEMGLRNALETNYSVPRARTQIAYRVLMDSAGQAGLFDTRGGARTHWVKPVMPEGEETEVDQEAPLPDEGPRGELDQPLPQSRVDVDPARRLRQILVEKVREVDAGDLETIKEYIKLIEELEEKEKGGGGDKSE